jgi:hypothetical protein
MIPPQFHKDLYILFQPFSLVTERERERGLVIHRKDEKPLLPF